MPNVGKSTLFNVRDSSGARRPQRETHAPHCGRQVLTKCSIPAENFPFCTIDPNSVRARAQPATRCSRSAGNARADPRDAVPHA